MKDVVIIGGGPASMSAGIYAARKKLKVVVIAKDFGGYVKETDKIENYLGFESIQGIELAKKFESHLRSYDLEILEDTEVKNVYQKKSEVFTELENRKTIKSKTAIIAAGSKRKKLGIPGEKKFLNKGVTYCTVCDGPLFKNKKVAVIGGGNSGIESAIYLSKITKEVYLIEREKELFGDKILIEKLKKCKNVKLIHSSEPKEIFGEKEVEELIYKELKTNKEKSLEVSGIFIEVGIEPNSSIAKVKKDKEDYIKVDENMKTSSDRIFAVGDINNKGPKQIAIAVGQGCIAALEVDKIVSRD